MAAVSPRSSLTDQSSGRRTVATFVQLLAGAVKHHSLYPEHHSIAQQHLAKIFSTLTSLLESRKTLRLDIDREDIVYDGSVLYPGKTDDKDIAFLLGRDGVEWLEFLTGIEPWEIQSLLRVINSNRRSDIENDGNIATALWEQDLPHIEYKTIDLTAMDIPLLNLNAFRVAPSADSSADNPENQPSHGAQWQDYYSSDADLDDSDSEGEEQETAHLALTSPNTALWHLSEIEQVQLDALIRKEQEGVDTESTIEVLLILLLLQDDQQEAVEIMDFLQDRFLHCLQQYEFKHALKIMGTLEKIRQTPNKRQQQLSPLITELFHNVSRQESLRDLEKFFTDSDQSVPANAVEPLWTLLRLLPPEVLQTLAPLSERIDIQRFGPQFLALFEYFCEQDSQNLAVVAENIDKKICLHLFPFFSRIRMDEAIPVLSALALHPAQIVRSKAFQLLARWNVVDLEKLLPLVDDPDESIRQALLAMIGRERNEKIEQLFCRHMEEHAGVTEDREHILACYHALGRVGGSACIPFLEKRLLQVSSIGTLFASGGGAHKEGAARALLALRNPEARKIVREGATSMIPDVRAACRKAQGGRHA